jgi:polycomb protein EED
LSEKDLAKSKENWAKKYDMTDAWTDIAPHKEEVVRGIDFTGRQCAWSVGGEWCVIVGSAGALAIFERWSQLPGVREVV